MRTFFHKQKADSLILQSGYAFIYKIDFLMDSVTTFVLQENLVYDYFQYKRKGIGQIKIFVKIQAQKNSAKCKRTVLIKYISILIDNTKESTDNDSVLPFCQ